MASLAVQAMLNMVSPFPSWCLIRDPGRERKHSTPLKTPSTAGACRLSCKESVIDVSRREPFLPRTTGSSTRPPARETAFRRSPTDRSTWAPPTRLGSTTGIGTAVGRADGGPAGRRHAGRGSPTCPFSAMTQKLASPTAGTFGARSCSPAFVTQAQQALGHGSSCPALLRMRAPPGRGLPARPWRARAARWSRRPSPRGRHRRRAGGRFVVRSRERSRSAPLEGARSSRHRLPDGGARCLDRERGVAVDSEGPELLARRTCSGSSAPTA